MSDVYQLWPARTPFVNPETGQLTPEAVKAMGRIAKLFGSQTNTLPVTFVYVPAGGSAYGIVYLDADGGLTSTAAPSDGQILIGDTGGVPVLGTITGTANQITVTSGAGSITLSLPQNIHSAASPTFAGLTLTGLTAQGLAYVGAGDALASTGAATDGQILIGDTGSNPVAATITGTANQVTVTNGPGSITLSTPQDIAPGSNPTFDGVVLTGPVNLSDAGAGQIQFPATQNPSADANTLDDYEEGAWTPGISFGGGTTGITYSSQVGAYTKIGNRVFFNGRLQLSAKGSSTGAVLVTGLPFSSQNTTNLQSPVAFLLNNLDATASASPYGVVVVNSTTINIYSLVAGTLVAMDDADFASTSIVNVSGHYVV